jgi:hypothetical protein
MSEQPNQQPITQPCEQPVRRWPAANFGDHGFKPGQSGNPRGRATVSDRVRAETFDLIAQFEERHGRAPKRSERSAIEIAAHFRVQAKREKLTMEDRNKAARTAALYERKLGLDRVMRASTNGSSRSLLEERGK